VRTIRYAMVSTMVSGDPNLAKPEPPFSISDEQWAETEKAYGHKLEAAIRLKVLQVTTSFVMFEEFERAALRSAEAEKRVQSIKESAGEFYSYLFSGAGDDATVFADELIDRHFNERMPQLRELLLSLRAACNSALTEMETSPGHREGARWDQWICDLTTILDAADLRTAASKGSAKSKPGSSSSAFVSFVKKLQGCVPREARRHYTHGTATAINRARKGLGSKLGGPAPKK
jgi:hypothetical protein